ncbi:MAG: hypothetical protein K9J12_10615 [Melioribacteraceae bacterium]|nr:hypothetical protein [Melioribacteraceae bacterium]
MFDQLKTVFPLAFLTEIPFLDEPIQYPTDGHSPQHFITEPELIKKITLKVKLYEK